MSLGMMNQAFRFAARFVTVLAFCFLSVATAGAAPQILGLVASNGLPTPLHCRDGTCSGSLPSFCLQEARTAPYSGSEYHLAAVGGLTLVASLANGRSLRLPGNELFSIHTRFGFTTVRVTLPQAGLQAFGIEARNLESLAVEVEPGTTLLPIASADDRNPQTPEEIARASGPLRRLATEIFDRPGYMVDAARLVGLVTDELPPEPQAPVVLRRIWQQVAGAAKERVDPAGMVVAARMIDDCERVVAAPDSFAVAACLDLRQAGLLATLNRRFWDAAGGS
jgi:hypothetical protein